MTPDERKQVAEDARMDARWESRVEALETEVKSIKSALVWATRAIWGGAVYLVMKLFDFLANGGSLR
jgi:hypothetical protein